MPRRAFYPLEPRLDLYLALLDRLLARELDDPAERAGARRAMRELVGGRDTSRQPIRRRDRGPLAGADMLAFGDLIRAALAQRLDG